jgi:putative flippase GtrA
VGAAGTVVYLAVYNGARDALPALLANVLATALALMISFWGNRRLAFGVTGRTSLVRDLALFSLVFFGTLTVSSLALVGLFAVTPEPGRVAENAALLVATAATFLVCYVLLSRWVFPQESSRPPAPPDR